MEYIKTVCIAAAFLSLATIFLPEREGVRRASLFAFSLILLLLLVPKDGSLSFDSLLSFSEAPPADTDATYEETVTLAAKEGLLLDLVERFSLSKEALSVEAEVSLSKEQVLFTSLHIYLQKENFFADVHSMLRYIENTYTSNCEVHFVGAQKNSVGH